MKTLQRQLMTVEDVANVLSLSPITIYRLAKRNDFPVAIKLIGAIRFDPGDIEEYIELRRQGKTYRRNPNHNNQKKGKQ